MEQTEEQRQQEEQRRQQEQQRRQAMEQGRAHTPAGQAAQPPSPQGSPEDEAEKARAKYLADLRKQQEAAFLREQRPRMIGEETRVYVPPANAGREAVRAGPMPLTFAVKGLQIFQRYGNRYQVVQEVEGGVLAVDLMVSQPKTVVFMYPPTGDELEDNPEETEES